MNSTALTVARLLPSLLTIAESAAIARTSASTVRHWLATGRLRSIKPGRRRLIRRGDLALLLGTPHEDLAR